jgi:hypothetical protein
MPRIRSERPAFDAKFPQLAVDTSKAAQHMLEQTMTGTDDRSRVGAGSPPA